MIVLDGGFATELERRGVPASGRLWSTRAVVEHPAEVERLHRDYLEAGADVISTATYQGALSALAEEGLDGRAVLARAVALAREARDAVRPSARVAASMGPYGAHLADGSEYRGDYRVDAGALADFHRAQLEVLLGAGADLLLFETLPSLAEAEAVLEATRDVAIPVWISFSLRDARTISSGEALDGAARLAATRAAVVGLNCAPARTIEAALSGLRGAGLRLAAYPNSGETWDAEARAWRGASDGFAEVAAALEAAGAEVIGGCCRTGPDEVRAIARLAGR